MGGGGGFVDSDALRERTRCARCGMEWLNVLQWPAMVATVLAAWLVAAQSKRRRMWGFWCFLSGNTLWVLWGWHDHAWALMVLQVCLAALNIRGAKKNDPEQPRGERDAGARVGRGQRSPDENE